MSPAAEGEETTVMALGHGPNGLQPSDKGGVSPRLCAQVARGQPQFCLYSSMTQVLKGWQPVNSSAMGIVCCSHPLSLAVAQSTPKSLLSLSENCMGSKRGVSQRSGWLLFRGTGMMVRDLKQASTRHVSSEVLKMSLSTGARWPAQCFTLEGETESGPAAWRDFRL